MGDRIPAHNEDTQYVNLAGMHDKVYNRHVTSGRFLKLRRLLVWPLLLGYFLTPWFEIAGRQAMLFDLPERKFHIFWATFYPQDGFLLAWLLIISAFSLFAVTNVFGRVWCGFTCPQTVWTQIFMWLEYKIEGDRGKRMKLDKQSWGPEKILRKGGKHASWLFVGFLTGLTFVGYFTPIKELTVDIFTLEASTTAAFWVVFFLLATYGNAGFLREQVCKYMCPYARFQSVMYDSNTLVVSYDADRGEKRGPRKPKQDYKADGLGDCVDCTWCVQVCPVDIDIRDGLQYECINCGLCVDACNSIMDKMGYEKDLISFNTENNLAGKPTRFLRPRLIGYVFFILLMSGTLVYTLLNRVPLEVSVIADRNHMYRETSDGMIENPYRIRLVNMLDEELVYRVELIADEEMTLVGDTEIRMDGGSVKEGIIRVIMDPADIDQRRYNISIRVVAIDRENIVKEVETRFMAPLVTR
jgi:cytochrome c oxidase accessory protein FixG